MREAAFIKQNKSRWEEFERIVKDQQPASPDRLGELFIQVTDDLSFARTQYPESRVTQYLNTLASRVHLKIYKNKREEAGRFARFWKRDVPLAIYEARKPLLYSFVVFTVTMIIGAVSTLHDDTFVRLILGDGYVNMTLENIEQGNPTAVYGNSSAAQMFLRITWNNVRVSFIVFVAGLFTSLGTGLLLLHNGIVIGSFIAFFYQQNQLSHALPVIMLHGTIELSSLVVAGAAGFVMGNGLLFPGTYSRLASFMIAARKGLVMIIGLSPFFVIAGFIESFITRHAFMHWAIKAMIIALSALLMIYYFVIYPRVVVRKHGRQKDH